MEWDNDLGDAVEHSDGVLGWYEEAMGERGVCGDIKGVSTPCSEGISSKNSNASWK